MKKILFSLFIGAGLFFCTKSYAQNQIFIKAVGITNAGSPVGTFDGGSTVKGHAKEIEAIAYSDGLAGCENIGKGGGGGACKVSKAPFRFSMPLSNAVISFKHNLLNGKFLNSVDMAISKGGGEGVQTSELDFYKVHMESVLVSSISEGGSSGDHNNPAFNIELVPTRVAWEITTQDSKGAFKKISYGWDFSQNKAFIYAFPLTGGGTF